MPSKAKIRIKNKNALVIYTVKMFGEVLMNNISGQDRSWDHTLPLCCDVTTTWPWELQQSSTVNFNRFIFTLTQPIDFLLHRPSMLIVRGLIWASGSMFWGSRQPVVLEGQYDQFQWVILVPIYPYGHSCSCHFFCLMVIKKLKHGWFQTPKALRGFLVDLPSYWENWKQLLNSAVVSLNVTANETENKTYLPPPPVRTSYTKHVYYYSIPSTRTTLSVISLLQTCIGELDYVSNLTRNVTSKDTLFTNSYNIHRCK